MPDITIAAAETGAYEKALAAGVAQKFVVNTGGASRGQLQLLVNAGGPVYFRVGGGAAVTAKGTDTDVVLAGERVTIDFAGASDTVELNVVSAAVSSVSVTKLSTRTRTSVSIASAGGGGGGGGDASAAKQDAQTALLTAIDADTSRIIAAPATEAKQDTGNASLATIAGNLPQGAGAAGVRTITATDDPVLGRVTALNVQQASPAATGALAAIDTLGRSQVSIQVSGVTTPVFTIEGSNDGVTYVTISGSFVLWNRATGAAISTAQITANGLYGIRAGYRYIRLNRTTAGTGAGTINWFLTDSGPESITLAGALPGFAANPTVALAAGAAAIGSVVIGAGAAAIGSLTAGTATIGKTGPATPTRITPKISNGDLMLSSSRTSFTQLMEICCTNNTAADVWLFIVDKASAPVASDTAAVRSYKVTAGSTLQIEFGAMGMILANGLAFYCAAAKTGAGNVGAAADTLYNGVVVGGSYYF